MAIFISYSHEDKDFVDKFAAQLVNNNAHVWVDTWELNVGDSIVRKVQEAIERSSALIVVLSKSSVTSEWCSKELSAGLVRELEEKRVIVLPVLIEDCEIPMFLREKRYADFRTDYDAGLNAVLEAIARVTNNAQGRLEEEEYFVDWAMDWFEKNGLMGLMYVIAEMADRQPYTVITEVLVECNGAATKRWKQYDKISLGWVYRLIVTESICEFLEKENFKIIIDDNFPKRTQGGIIDPKTGIGYTVTIVSRRLGADTGKEVLLNIAGHLGAVRNQMRETSRKLTPEETIRLAELIGIGVA